MVDVLKNSWALLLGVFLLLLGNGLQGSLLGVRGPDAGFSPLAMSVIMSGYFAGFLIASRTVPVLIRRVGHVRVFAFLGSLTSAVLLVFPAVTDPIVWAVSRVVLGFCFCGVYVTAESWLNNAATNETRGQTLSAYMIVQTVGIITAQGLLVVPDPTGFLLFVIPSMLVSLSFAPILLSIQPTPAFETSKPMTLVQVYRASPLGCVGIFLLGGVFAAQFGMAAVYGKAVGLSLPQISAFIASFYVGALVLQYPFGWLSDRMDRRALILGIAVMGATAATVGVLFGQVYDVLLAVAFVIGGASNPLYSLLIAYTNDFLEAEDMASASAGLYFINGVGAVAGPLVIGWSMQSVGPEGFFMLIATLLCALSGYAAWRMTRRAAPDETAAYAALSPALTAYTLETAQEYAQDAASDTGTDDAPTEEAQPVAEPSSADTVRDWPRAAGQF
ncbi:MFS transporter [Citreimonas sp.]|uniref:MFS transporter n=1 Tax=Citreimonas sp. TaxID=3036715 RepID=UPI0040599544